MMTEQQLTEREQQGLEHVKKAGELKYSLARYAAAFTLDVKDLYEAKRRLVRKGVIARRTKSWDGEQRGGFVPVRIVPAVPVPASMSGAMSCRIVHASGWVIECGALPQASWIAAVVNGGAHATA